MTEKREYIRHPSVKPESSVYFIDVVS